MHAPENFFSPLLLYHLPTCDDDTTGRSLRPILAVSTFATESVVRTFTRARKSVCFTALAYQIGVKAGGETETDNARGPKPSPHTSFPLARE